MWQKNRFAVCIRTRDIDLQSWERLFGPPGIIETKLWPVVQDLLNDLMLSFPRLGSVFRDSTLVTVIWFEIRMSPYYCYDFLVKKSRDQSNITRIELVSNIVHWNEPAHPPARPLPTIYRVWDDSSTCSVPTVGSIGAAWFLVDIFVFYRSIRNHNLAKNRYMVHTTQVVD